MPALYLVQRGATLTARSEQLIVREGREMRQRVPVRGIDRVAVLAPTHLTSEAIALCARSGVELVIAARGRTGVVVRLGATADGIALRHAQHGLADDPIAVLRLARAIVIGKIRNQRRLLSRSRAGTLPDVRLARDELGKFLERAERAETLSALRGVEGGAAAAYFRGFTRLINPEFGFTGRNRRPPRDPANALLSFAYMLLTSEVAAEVAATGLEPALGFFHGPRAGRPALALDLVEEFRAPVADALVLHVAGRRMIRPSQFRPEGRGVWMSPSARRRLVESYEAKVTSPLADGGGAPTTLRKQMRAQAVSLAATIRNGTAYEPFRLP